MFKLQQIAAKWTAGCVEICGSFSNPLTSDSVISEILNVIVFVLIVTAWLTVDKMVEQLHGCLELLIVIFIWQLRSCMYNYMVA